MSEGINGSASPSIEMIQALTTPRESAAMAEKAARETAAMAEEFTSALQRALKQAMSEIQNQASDGGVNDMGSRQTTLPTTMNPQDMNW